MSALDPYRPPFLFGTSRLYPLMEAVTGRFLLDRAAGSPSLPPLEALGDASGAELDRERRDVPRRVPAGERVLRLRYEDILARPRDELGSRPIG